MNKHLLLTVFAFFLTMACAKAIADEAQTFTLKGVRSHEDYGPFLFRRGTLLKLESGLFRLSILPDNKAFTLTDTENGLSYGVYELVLGRMIDIGDVLFTITGMTAPPVTPTVKAQPSILDDTEFGIDISLVNEVAYDWEINGQSGGESRDIERRNVTLKARKGLFAVQAGLLTDSRWDHTIAGSDSTFTEAEITEGKGWFAAVGLSIPVLKEGRWSARINAEVIYRREEFSLQYGTWEIESITSTVDLSTPGTNDVADTESSAEEATTTTNSVSTTTFLRFNNYDKDVTLTETLVSAGAQIAYHAPAWFLYAGIRALPWTDTSLNAVITSDDRKFKIEFTRKDPVMAYGGIGLDFLGLRSYIEMEGGGENTLRLGISRSF